MANKGSNDISVLINDSSFAAPLSFQPAVNYPVGLTPVAVAVGDFNGDGKLMWSQPIKEATTSVFCWAMATVLFSRKRP